MMWTAAGPLQRDEVHRAVAVAAGRAPGSLLLTGVEVVNVFSGEVLPGPVLLAGRLIAGMGPPVAGAAAEATLDLGGALLAPGFVDGHVHLESSLVEPGEYARAVVPRGVTAVVWDPHEWANVAGAAAFDAALAGTRKLPLDVFLTASSCVPASPLETAGANLTADDLEMAMRHERVVGLGELMNFPGVTAGLPAELEKAWRSALRGRVVDGHAPLLSGRDLQAYVAAGVNSDHECLTVDEAREKLRLGLTIFIREGSGAHNLADLLPLVTPETAGRICLVTDDRHPHDLVREGGVDYAVRLAVQKGLDVPTAIKLATINPCRYFGLPRRGAVAPGYCADLVALDPKTLEARTVLKAGQVVARDGELLVPVNGRVDGRLLNSVQLPALGRERLRVPGPPGEMRVIGVIPGQIVTETRIVQKSVRSGEAVADAARDLAKLAVIERHGGNGGVGVGFVQGFGLQRGALASTVAHDAHNLIIAGMNDDDMLLAARTVAEAGGGFAVVAGGQVLAQLDLPIAGLMSRQPLATVILELDRLEAAARGLGVTIPSPFMTLSFLALSVIPTLKLTDQGLVDATAGRLVSLNA